MRIAPLECVMVLGYQGLQVASDYISISFRYASKKEKEKKKEKKKGGGGGERESS